jgi:hypothetical protein
MTVKHAPNAVVDGISFVWVIINRVMSSQSVDLILVIVLGSRSYKERGIFWKRNSVGERTKMHS